MRVLSLFHALYAFLSASVALISARHLESRALLPSVDTCAYVNTNVFTLLHLADLTGQGNLAVCLCASTVGPYVQANVVTSIVADLVGEDAVVNALVNLILGSGNHCTYPAHAVPVCLQSNPCDFGCDAGYTKSSDGKSCVCSSPKIECNGVCQTQACSSAVPQGPSKRDTNGIKRRTRVRVLTEERCPRGHVLCGAGASRRRHEAEWECIDTRRTLDSCGGCMFPFVFDDYPVTGTDCSSLPGVSGVQCHAGRCLVHRCKRGWSIAPSKSECIQDGGIYNSTL